MNDPRPTECRFRLRDEYKAYPKSGCTACGRSVLKGLGTECHLGPSTRPEQQEPDRVEVVALHTRTLAEQVTYCADTLDAQLAPPQKIVDGVSLALRQIATEIEALEAKHRDAEEVPRPPAIEDQCGLGWRAVLAQGDSVIMTVTNFVVVGDTIRTVVCSWHDADRRPQQAEYPFAALRVRPPEANNNARD